MGCRIPSRSCAANGHGDDYLENLLKEKAELEIQVQLLTCSIDKEPEQAPIPCRPSVKFRRSRNSRSRRTRRVKAMVGEAAPLQTEVESSDLVIKLSSDSKEHDQSATPQQEEPHLEQRAVGRKKKRRFKRIKMGPGLEREGSIVMLESLFARLQAGTILTDREMKLVNEFKSLTATPDAEVPARVDARAASAGKEKDAATVKAEADAVRAGEELALHKIAQEKASAEKKATEETARREAAVREQVTQRAAVEAVDELAANLKLVEQREAEVADKLAAKRKLAGEREAEAADKLAAQKKAAERKLTERREAEEAADKLAALQKKKALVEKKIVEEREAAERKLAAQRAAEAGDELAANLKLVEQREAEVADKLAAKRKLAEEREAEAADKLAAQKKAAERKLTERREADGSAERKAEKLIRYLAQGRAPTPSRPSEVDH